MKPYRNVVRSPPSASLHVRDDLTSGGEEIRATEVTPGGSFAERTSNLVHQASATFSSPLGDRVLQWHGPSFFDPTHFIPASVNGGTDVRMQRSAQEALASHPLLDVVACALWHRTFHPQVVGEGTCAVCCSCDVVCAAMTILLVMPVMSFVKVVSSFP